MEKRKNDIKYSDTYKLVICYKDSKAIRNYYFCSIFQLYRFMYIQLHKEHVDSLKVVRIDV